MATQRQLLEQDTPVDIKDTLSLADGENYLLIVTGGRSILLSVQAAEPTDLENGIPLNPGDDIDLLNLDESVWIWCTRGESAVHVT